jgi:hypothetical protein
MFSGFFPFYILLLTLKLEELRVVGDQGMKNQLIEAQIKLTLIPYSEITMIMI